MRIGDIYNRDGIKGVVVYVDNSGVHGLIMSLDEAAELVLFAFKNALPSLSSLKPHPSNIHKTTGFFIFILLFFLIFIWSLSRRNYFACMSYDWLCRTQCFIFKNIRT